MGPLSWGGRPRGRGAASLEAGLSPLSPRQVSATSEEAYRQPFVAPLSAVGRWFGVGVLLFLAAVFGSQPAFAADGTPGPVVEVRILSSQRPAQLEVRGAETWVLHASGDKVVVGAEDLPTWELPQGRWRLRTGSLQRTYVGSISIRARAGELQLVVGIPLEAYVAQVLAAETVPGTPPAALQANAVAIRSYAVASVASAGRRHDIGDLCDLSHCQVLRGRHGGPHGREARAAARATEGQVLVSSDSPGGQRVHDAPFHASCGGHTASPTEIFGGPGDGRAHAVPDGACSATRWEWATPRALVEEAAARWFGRGVSLTGLRRSIGTGGFVSRVEDPRTGRFVSGDTFVREIDRRLGWGKIRSARFDWEIGPSSVRFVGSGVGHGVGLCQQGAARMAQAGANHQAILAHFFAGLRLAFLSDLDPGG